jgi:hypothetical protein
VTSAARRTFVSAEPSARTFRTGGSALASPSWSAIFLPSSASEGSPAAVASAALQAGDARRPRSEAIATRSRRAGASARRELRLRERARDGVAGHRVGRGAAREARGPSRAADQRERAVEISADERSTPYQSIFDRQVIRVLAVREQALRDDSDPRPACAGARRRVEAHDRRGRFL